MDEKNIGIGIAAGLLILALGSTTGCETAFDPFQDNDRYAFSIYGYLDASADTQWVRVTPVRESLTLLPETVEANVRVEHLSNGATAVLHDSLFQFFHDVYAYNFWTTIDLLPEASYRLTVEASDGRSSMVTVTLPEDFPIPVVRIADRRIDSPDFVYVEGVAHLADVQTIYYLRTGTVVFRPHLQDTVRIAPRAYEVSIDPYADLDYIDEFFGGAGQIVYAQIFVAAAGPGWPPFASIDEKIVSLPEGISNVENGVGYLGGVLSKTIPYEICLAGGTLVNCPE